MSWACSTHEGEESYIQGFLVETTEGKRPLGIPRRRWEDNIKMNTQEVRCGAWTGLSWLRIRTVGGHV